MIDEPDINCDSMDGQTAMRKLRLFSAGSRQFAVFEDEIATVADWREPVPLPQAPKSVLGIVSVQGRMLTVLDLAKFVDWEVDRNVSQGVQHGRQILALRGDEQIALAIDMLGVTVEIAEQSLQKELEEGALVHAVLKQDEQDIHILRVAQLFPSAIQGRERRRRRF
jgi:purine-binding chemotaxis protein CheW